MKTRRLAFIGAVIGGVFAAGMALAQQPQFFRIGTGGTAGTYYPIGGLIANAISNPPGSRPCDQGGSCGVPGLIATALSANGSVANVNAIAGGTLESGFSQSDVATWAHSGTGIWEDRPAVEKLRAIANCKRSCKHCPEVEHGLTLNEGHREAAAVLLAVLFARRDHEQLIHVVPTTRSGSRQSYKLIVD